MPHPPFNAETRRRRESCRRLHRTARFRPSDDREPLGRDTDPNARIRHGVPTQRLALSERKPRYFSSSFNCWEERTSPSHERKEKQNRRATGTSAGEKRSGDERLRSEFASFSPATGDRPIAGRSALNKWFLLAGSAIASLCGRVGGWPSCLCVFVVATWVGGWICVICVICVICGHFGWGEASPQLCASAFFSLCPLCVSVPLWFFFCRR